MAKQSALVSARQTRDKLEAGLERAAAIAAGMVAEGDILDEAARAETHAAVDALTAGGDLPKPGAKKTAHAQRVDLEGRQRGVADAIAALESQLAEAETAIEAAKAGEKAAVDQVIAARASTILAKALKLEVEKRALLPELNSALAMNLKVDGLRDFVLRPAHSTVHELSRTVPDVVSTSAMLRAWKAALESDPMAEPSTEAGAALEAAEASAQAAREAAERLEAEKYKVEMAAQREEQYRPQREANEKYERKHRADPTLRNRVPLQGTYLPDPCAVTLNDSSHEGNSY